MLEVNLLLEKLTLAMPVTFTFLKDYWIWNTNLHFSKVSLAQKTR